MSFDVWGIETNDNVKTIFGEVHEGSDSLRVYSYSGDVAETPDNISAGGWNGVAHTYCGTD